MVRKTTRTATGNVKTAKDALGEERIKNLFRTLDISNFNDGPALKPKPLGNRPDIVPLVAQRTAHDLTTQNFKHRDTLLRLVVGLSLSGFVLLSVATIVQMTIRIWNPDYTGISDTALNILAVSVFGEVIAVVATIVRLVWNSTDKPG